MSSADLERNVSLWTKVNAEFTDASAEKAWARDEITWGKWRGVEAELNVLGEVEGKDVVELGCGTAYFSAWLAKLGARPVGVDITPAQLDTARSNDASGSGTSSPKASTSASSIPVPSMQRRAVSS